MERNSLRWLVRGVGLILIGWCVTSLVCTQIVPSRSMVVEFSGDPANSIVATVTVDGHATVVTKPLPAQFQYQAKQLFIVARLLDTQSQDQISAKIAVDGNEMSSVTAPSGGGVYIGFKGSGLLGQGKRQVWSSGIAATQLAAR